MAKVRAPLLSATASGSVGALTFSTQEGHLAATTKRKHFPSVIRSKPSTRPPAPSTLQAAFRAESATIATAWASLSPTEKARWKNTGVFSHRATLGGTVEHYANGWALFVKEWHLQQITAPAIPLCPAPSY
jgi:hypothetical protein